jgi:cytochrome c553
MMRARVTLYLSLLFFVLPLTSAYSADLANGEELHKKCALCHGQWSQGIKGGLYPRLAGMPSYYLLHQFDLYARNVRNNVAMTTVGGLATSSQKDLEDLAAFIESIDLEEKAPLDIPTYSGDPELGAKLFKGDCKNCHGSDGKGKAKKKTPPLRGQYTEYLAKQIENFNSKKRHHDNDPEDETFVDYSPEEIEDILTYISTLDDK